MTSRQYISVIILVIFFIAMFMIHKMCNIIPNDEFLMNTKVIQEQQEITDNVTIRLKELEMVMDSANNMSQHIIENESIEKAKIKSKNMLLDIENEQLSNAINDLFIDTIVVRDTVHITHKK